MPNSNRKLTIQQRKVKGEKHKAKRAKKQVQARARGLPDTVRNSEVRARGMKHRWK